MSAKKKRQQLKSQVMLWLIFLPILLFGIFLLGLAANMIRNHLRAQSWQPVAATLLASYAEHSSQKIDHASRQGGRFGYAWQGQRHASTQLSFSRMYSRSFGAEIDDWDERLAAVIGGSGQPLTVYVNPNNPAEAVALPDVRWSEMAIYLGLGFFLCWAGSFFLFGTHHQAPQAPAFSWRAVATMAAVGAPLLVLAPLLWRDQHGVWAVLVCLPMLLAFNGVVHGLRLRRTTTPNRQAQPEPKSNPEP